MASRAVVAVLFAVVMGVSGGYRGFAAEDSAAAQIVQFPIASAEPAPLLIRGTLRRPEGPGPFAAIVLLHGCEGDWRGIDERWGRRLAEWDYVALTVDSYGPRGIDDTCQGGRPADRSLDDGIHEIAVRLPLRHLRGRREPPPRVRRKARQDLLSGFNQHQPPR